SRRHEYFFSYLKTKTEILPAILENRAGIIGAALAAYRAFK
ncbi:MAG: ROK family protein, partial [Candidatus Aminicenantes bacterium]|nr:ROK family protein [Candidatus Aminicenantes bacterium]